MNILSKQIGFMILAAPLATENTLLGHIQLIGGERFNHYDHTIEPYREDRYVKVIPLRSSAIGFDLQEIIRQISGIPVKLVYLDDYHGAANSDDK